MSYLNDGIAIVLANRNNIYELLKHLFGYEPTLELMKVTVEKHTRDVLKLMLDEDEHQFDDYFDLLNKLENSITSEAAGTMEKLKCEYTYLMIGPSKLPAPPWESVYLSKDRIIFQESTLKVRRAYLKYQFLPANYPHEADDHIALELDFMAHLSKLSLERFEEENIEALIKLLHDQKEFLEEHLLKWIGEFAKQIQLSKTKHFYPQTAVLTEQVLKIDAETLDELISLLE